MKKWAEVKRDEAIETLKKSVEKADLRNEYFADDIPKEIAKLAIEALEYQNHMEYLDAFPKGKDKEMFYQHAIVKSMGEIERLRNETERQKTFSFLDGVAEGLKNPIEQPSEEWIPVGDSVPIEHEQVIVTIGKGKERSVTQCVYSEDSKFWEEYVVAWMSMPKAYKEEEEV